MKKEMLSIVATLEEFHGMLLGANIHVFMDHKNLAFDTLKTQQVLHWRTKVEELSLILHYIEGSKNILADNMSHLHRLLTPTQIAEGKKLIESIEVTDKEYDDAYFLEQEYSDLYD